MGVLETRQGDGTYVTSLDASLLLAPMAFLVDLGTAADAFHLQAVRRVLETEAAGRAAQLITDSAIGEASDILAEVEPCSPRPAMITSVRSSRPTSRFIVSSLTRPEIRHWRP
jgi:DNA-binding FadR family transcriptional regulator